MCLVPQGACHTDMDIIMSDIIGRQSQRSMRKLTGQTEKALVGHVTHPRLFCDRVQLAVGLDPFACRKAHSSRSNKTGLVYPERCLDRGVEGRDSTGAKRRRANEDASWRGVKGREKCGAKTFGVRALVPTFLSPGSQSNFLYSLTISGHVYEYISFTRFAVSSDCSAGTGSPRSRMSCRWPKKPASCQISSRNDASAIERFPQT